MKHATPSRLARRLLHCLLPALLLPFSAHADWRYAETPPSVAANSHRFIAGRNGELWTFGETTVRHTDAAGRTTTVQRGSFSPLLLDASFDYGVAQDDGGIILFSHRCRLQRVDAQLRTGATIELPDCKNYGANARGTVWTATDTSLSQLRSDGVARQTIQIGPAQAPEQIGRLSVAADGGVLVLSRTPDYSQARLSRYDSSGRQSWTWAAPAAQVQTFAEAADGSVIAFARSPSGLSLSRLDSSGRVFWSRQYTLDDDLVMAVEPAEAGAFYLVSGAISFGDSIARSLLRFEADGTLAWRRDICPNPPPGVSLQVPLSVAADGQVSALCPGDQSRVLRRDRFGTTVADIILPLRLAHQMQRQPDGSLLILGQTTDMPSRSRLLKLDRNGQISASQLGEPLDYALLRTLAQHIASDGSTYLLTQADNVLHQPVSQFLSKIDADGRRVWQRELSSTGVREAQLSAAAGRVCVHELAQASNSGEEIRRAFCLDIGDGRTYWMSEKTVVAFDAPVHVKVLYDGTTLLLHSTSDSHEIRTVAANGSDVRTTGGAGYAELASFDETGRVSLMVGSNIVQYQASGQRSFLIDRNGFSNNRVVLSSADDGSLVVAGQRNDNAAGPWLWSIKPDGSTRWQVPLGVQYQDVDVVQRGDALYVLESFPPWHSPVFVEPSRVSRYTAASGDLKWRYESRNPVTDYTVSRSGGGLAVSPSGNEVLLMHSWNNRLRLQRLDSANGQRQEERFYACNTSCAQPANFAVDSTGTAFAAYTGLDAAFGQTAQVQAMSHATATKPRTRLDQPGINGLWYSPYANGEGISLDWIAGPRVLFGAWFTYTARGGNSTSELRWYTIQANDITAGSTSLELPILETLGGNFDAGPSARPQRVGTATLSFSDCDNGTLRYDFDAGHNDGLDGTITLSRLTPATESCILADGSVRPGAGAKPPQNGFDARMSGSWYEDATNGQGLQFSIQPGGVFFTPWFTYDPQGQGNDPNREHWFTLQGNLANATNGSAEVVIAQSIGGAFDRVPTYNGYAIGKATVTMLGCDRAKVDYRFDDDERAGAFRGRTGTLDLTKIGGCAP